MPASDLSDSDLVAASSRLARGRGSELGWVVGKKLFQHRGPLGEGGLSGLGRPQELGLPSDDVPAQSRLKIDDQPLKMVGHHQHLLGPPRATLCPAGQAASRHALRAAHVREASR